VVLPAACSCLIVGARSAARDATRRPFDRPERYLSDVTGFERFGFADFLAAGACTTVIGPLLTRR
jgi:hypothetical protein